MVMRDYTNPIDTNINNANDGVVNGVHSDIKARVISIIHPVSRKKLTYVLLDLAFPSENIRRRLVEELRKIDPDFESASLVLTATHTHSAPGGHSCYLGYETLLRDIDRTYWRALLKTLIRPFFLPGKMQ
jgi:neutral ceramidase